MSALELNIDLPTDTIFVWALISDNVAEKIAFDINDALSLNLYRSRDIINPLTSQKQLFIHFFYEHPSLEQQWWLIRNQAYHTASIPSVSEGLFAERLDNLPLLLPSLSLYNYFLVATGCIADSTLLHIKNQLKKTSSLRSAESVNLTRIKNIENLIYPEYVNKPSKNSIDLRPRVRRL